MEETMMLRNGGGSMKSLMLLRKMTHIFNVPINGLIGYLLKLRRRCLQ